ncbi:MAG: hypothetical protein JNL02_08250 [Saprospiraceae bacterium]|nr:hypothetical protein [Saprospiraceae bacterium]
MKNLLFIALFSPFLSVAATPEFSPASQPVDSLAPTFVLKRPGEENTPRFPMAFYAFAGIDPEPTQRERINFIPFLNIVNIAMGYRMNLGPDWQLSAELWSNSYATPRIEVIDIQHLDREGDRITLRDTTSLMRLRGAVFSLSGARRLPAGFSLHTGVQMGYYPLAMLEYGRSAESAVSLDYSRQSGWDYDYVEAPDWIQRFQPALRFGLEKRFFDNYILGLSMQQTLTDLSKLGDTRNMPMVWMVYAGYRIDLD